MGIDKVEDNDRKCSCSSPDICPVCSTLRTSFSFLVDCPDEDTARILVASLEDAMDPDGFEERADGDLLDLDDCFISYTSRKSSAAIGNRVQIASKDGTNLEFLADVLQNYLRKNDPESSIGFSWAHTCGTMRPGEFGGGAVCIDAKRQTWLDTDKWIEQTIGGDKNV